jgi:hypothetical protein
MRIDGKASIDGVRNILGMLRAILSDQIYLVAADDCISYDARNSERDKQDETSVITLIYVS